MPTLFLKEVRLGVMQLFTSPCNKLKAFFLNYSYNEIYNNFYLNIWRGVMQCTSIIEIRHC